MKTLFKLLGWIIFGVFILILAIIGIRIYKRRTGGVQNENQ